MKTCPDCRQRIDSAARKCLHCGYQFSDGALAQDTRKAGTARTIGIILMSVLIAIVIALVKQAGG